MHPPPDPTPKACGHDDNPGRGPDVAAGNSGPALSETAGCLCLASRRAARSITRAFERELRPHGIRATQFSVLAILSLGGAKTIGALADALGLERTSLTRNLAVIAQRGWTAVRPGDDARVRHVEITPAGEAAIAAALPAWQAAQAAMTDALGEAGAKALRALSRQRAARTAVQDRGAEAPTTS